MHTMARFICWLIVLQFALLQFFAFARESDSTMSAITGALAIFAGLNTTVAAFQFLRSAR